MRRWDHATAPAGADPPLPEPAPADLRQRCQDRRPLCRIPGPREVVQVERHHALGPFPVRETFQTPDKIEIHLRGKDSLRDKQSAFRGDPLKDRLRSRQLDSRVPCADVLHNAPPCMCKPLQPVKKLQIFLEKPANILEQDLLGDFRRDTAVQHRLAEVFHPIQSIQVFRDLGAIKVRTTADDILASQAQEVPADQPADHRCCSRCRLP